MSSHVIIMYYLRLYYLLSACIICYLNIWTRQRAEDAHRGRPLVKGESHSN